MTARRARVAFATVAAATFVALSATAASAQCGSASWYALSSKTASGERMNADRALWMMLKVIASEGFTVHAGKVRIMRAHQRQTLAGLVVNDRPRVSRADYDSLRALLHNARRDGAASQNHAGHPDFRAHILGLIAWVGASDDVRRERLLRMASEVDWTS